MSRPRNRIPLGPQKQRLQVNKLPQPRLSIPLRQVTSSSTEEDYIRDIRHLGRLDQLGRHIDLVLRCRRHQTHGVRIGILETGSDVFDPAGLVRDNSGAELGEVSTAFGIGVESEAGDGPNCFGEVLVAEEEFGNQEAGVSLY